MKIGLGISAGLHLLVAGAIIASSWNTMFHRQIGAPARATRQVSVISSDELPGRQRPIRSARPKVDKSEPKATDKTVPSKEKESVKESGNGGKGAKGAKSASKGGISTGMSIDGAFPHGYYLELVEKKIESMFRPSTRIGGLVTELRFVLQRNGRITDLKLQKSSGNALFDQAAQRAVLSASPLPPLPGDYGGNTLGVTYIFRSE
ncbi:MAG: TonB C-terminal domain-containing protein [bacterium]|nr:TonB C-terminal domain-containing protein [bacterium]